MKNIVKIGVVALLLLGSVSAAEPKAGTITCTDDASKAALAAKTKADADKLIKDEASKVQALLTAAEEKKGLVIKDFETNIKPVEAADLAAKLAVTTQNADIEI